MIFFLLTQLCIHYMAANTTRFIKLRLTPEGLLDNKTFLKQNLIITSTALLPFQWTNSKEISFNWEHKNQIVAIVATVS